jgi:hypothetical protein
MILASRTVVSLLMAHTQSSPFSYGAYLECSWIVYSYPERFVFILDLRVVVVREISIILSDFPPFFIGYINTALTAFHHAKK